MSKVMKTVCVWFVIFILGMATGSMATPFVMSVILGNPYGREHLANKMLYINLLDKDSLSEEQVEQVDLLVGEYVAWFDDNKKEWYEERNKVIANFMQEMQLILTPAQYQHFYTELNDTRKRHRSWHKKKQDVVAEAEREQRAHDNEVYSQYQKYDPEFKKQYGDMIED